MKLYSVTITGVSDDTDINEILTLSKKYPWLEWGVLFSESASGNKPRYPSAKWINSLYHAMVERSKNSVTFDRPWRFAAHLCGKTMRRFVPGITLDEYDHGGWLTPFGLTESIFNIMFDRVQVNFNATRENFSPVIMTDMMSGWYESFDGNIITQHNNNNDWVWESIQDKEITMNALRAHHILHDASGGNGKPLEVIEPPIAGVLNGYAGGINPKNVISVIDSLDQQIPKGYVWIDMESGVRDETDHINMTTIHNMLSIISDIGEERNWF